MHRTALCMHRAVGLQVQIAKVALWTRLTQVQSTKYIQGGQRRAARRVIGMRGRRDAAVVERKLGRPPCGSGESHPKKLNSGESRPEHVLLIKHRQARSRAVPWQTQRLGSDRLESDRLESSWLESGWLEIGWLETGRPKEFAAAQVQVQAQQPDHVSMCLILPGRPVDWTENGHTCVRTSHVSCASVL